MFYEIKDKRVETGGTQTRWWLTAAFSGVVVTAGCVGIIFWLVMAVRQPETAYERRPSSSFRDYHHKINTKSSSSSSSSSPPPPLDYQTAEILKTTVKRKQGRVEMVKNSDDKLEADANDSFASDSDSEKNSKNSAPLPLPTTIESNDDDYTESTAAENDTADVQLRSKIAKLSSMREYDDDDEDGGNKHNRGGVHLKGGISPIEEQTSLPLPAADGSGRDGDIRGNSVKKKSEAVLPSWYDPNLQNANPSKPDPLNDLKQDGAYDLPDFSIIKPDLAAFNTKTIPAFTYLKEPLPRFEHMAAAAAAAAASGSPDVGNVDDSLYYHHHHHQHLRNNNNNHHQHHPHQLRQQDDNGADNNRIEQDQLIQEPFSSLNSFANEDFINAAGAAAAAVMTNTVGASAGANNYSLMNFLQSRLQNMHDWLLYGNKRNRTGSGHGGGGGGVDIMEIVKMVNNSLQAKTVGTIFSKLKDLYAGFNSSDVQNMPVSNLLYPTSPSLLSNSTSLVSFGLLAIDLFLLHNVQQIVWNEESQIGEEMLKDPDVVALNALFMSPDRVQQLKQTNSRIFTGTDRERKSVVHDLLEFINGGLRAVLNLSKAYKSSVSRVNARSTSNGSGGGGSSSGSGSGSTLDCIWTLYCRNLDKTAKLQGPYGFLAKMNSLGLRLMMGEFPVDKALDRLMKEYNSGWGSLDCDKLFPRCNAEEAKEIVIQTALGRSTF